MVALESLALERPLVATDVDGTPSLVVDGTTGWLVPPPEDERALAAAIVDCMRHPDEAARRARAGRELVEARFSTERMLDRLESLMIEVRGRRARMPGVKPRPYYRAVRAHQSARIAASRLRSARSWQGVRILGYHRITAADDVFGVTPAGFRRQMEHLVDSGVTVVRLSDALDLLERPLREPYVCVTFDDGYLDNLEHGLPVLEELEIPATIFVIGDVLEGKIGFTWYESGAPPRSPWRTSQCSWPAASSTYRRIPAPTRGSRCSPTPSCAGRWPGRRADRASSAVRAHELLLSRRPLRPA